MNDGRQKIDGKLWHYKQDQPYWMRADAAHALMDAIAEVKAKLNIDLRPTDRNAAGRLQSQQDAIVNRGSVGSNHNSNHLYGISIDFYPGGHQRLPKEVQLILAKHGFRQGDHRGPFGFGDYGHYTYQRADTSLST
jgi:hypothetical protein